jgi:hypothetical protein
MSTAIIADAIKTWFIQSIPSLRLNMFFQLALLRCAQPSSPILLVSRLSDEYPARESLHCSSLPCSRLHSFKDRACSNLCCKDYTQV